METAALEAESHLLQPYLDLYGDVLEAVVTRVPTIDLIPASRVSREWRCAIRSSLCRQPRRSPWLLLRHLRHSSSPIFSLHAFDPFSSSWVSVPQNSPSSDNKSNGTMVFLCGSTGDRLHSLSISSMVVSEDPFGTAWRKATKAPKVWRKDAVVAEVGRWVVVAGGGCPMVLEEGEEVGAVEVYDKHSGAWESAEPIPEGFDGSTSATWLSVAAYDDRLYVMEKKTGLVGLFDPKTKRWGPTCQPRPDPTVQSWAVVIGHDDRLLVVGVGPACQSTTKVRFWEVNRETLQGADNQLEEEMPREMVERLFPSEEGYDDTWKSYSVEVCGTERGGYVYNPLEMRNGVVFYEFAEEKGKIVGRWEWVPLPERVRECWMGRIEFGCSAVSLDELASFWKH
ncbi:F-box/kelch-repeat protein [Carex littledalei]|uniref:F-box/kelch-repeat protein n=1 Tax=Carex littledalei TaxID=544730 RepID=A0A833RB03_9POAL|nr:F-box/kelch-repeat protein [Carex littledalei]